MVRNRLDNQELLIPSIQNESSAINAQTRRGRMQMLFLLIVCAAPVIASYFAYYVFKPDGGKTNFGTLVYPAQPTNPSWFEVPFKGKWTLLVARPAENCRPGNVECIQALYLMRQVRVAVGRESSRIQLLWVNTDEGIISPEILRAYDENVAGMKIVSVPSNAKLKAEWGVWLNRENAGEMIQLVDPSGEKIMLFPVTSSPQDFLGIKKDLEKLLRLNHTGEVLQ